MLFRSWLTLPKAIDATRLLPKAVEAGVAFVPGATFFTGERQANTARLSFTLCTPEQIDEGIRRLAVLIAREAKG